MGARLRYAKVIDKQKFLVGGARLHPSLQNEVLVGSEPGTAAAFLLMRAWSEEKGTFTEQWRIETPGGTTIYEGTPRELHISTRDHIEKLQDEVADLAVEYAAEDYTVVFTLDDREVARTDFPVRPEGADGEGPP
jgi:hypothetical protein